MKEMKIILRNLKVLVVKNMRNFLLTLSLLLFVSTANATNTEFTAGTLDIINLPNQSGTTSWNLNDDSISSTINLGFNFDFYGETFTSGKGATNGCWTFTGYTNTCYDYTPDPLPQSGMDMTIFPLWGDWIRDSGSKMLYKTFGDTTDTDQYFVLGWYNMREYNRSSDNTFELWLYETTNNIEFRYGNLNITQHDIIIGVQGHATASNHAMYNANEYKVYLHHNECSSGTQHDSNDTNCVNTNWNSTSHNTAIENKSLSAVFDDQYGCAANSLLAATCTGYVAAYLTQQCNLDSLYDTACPNYSTALFDANCDDDSQFSPACPGYQVTQSVAYYDDTDYGYDDNTYEDQYGYDEYGYDDYYDEATTYSDDYYDDDPYANMEFTDQEWYEIDLAEFGQEQVDEWYGTDVEFSAEGLIDYGSQTEEEYWTVIDEGMDQYDIEQEQMFETFTDADWYDYDIEEFGQEQVDEWWGSEVEFSNEGNIVYEEYMEDDYYQEIYYEDEYYETDLVNAYDLEAEYERQYLLSYNEETGSVGQETIDTIEELDEWYEEQYEEYEEMYGEETEEEFQEEEYFAEESIEEEIAEELLANIEEEFIEIEEIRLVEEQEEMLIEETEVVVAGVREDKRGMDMEQALNVVASTVQAATNSMSGTMAGTSIQATGNTVSSGGISNSTATAIAASASSGGISTTSSPSISAQIASSAAQTQQILQMTPGSMGTSTGISSVNSNIGTEVAGISSVTISSTSEMTSTEVETTSSEVEVATADTSDTSIMTASTTGASSSDTSSSSSITITPMPGLDGQPQMAMADVQVQDMQGKIDASVSGVMTASEADQIADQIVAQNIEDQQGQMEEQLQQTGQYADESTLIAYLGYNPGFADYYNQSIPNKSDWYESREIYANVVIVDNVPAYYSLVGDNINTLNTMISQQPILYGGTL
jgi:hypothetical protein